MLLLPPTVWFPTFLHLVYRCYVLSRAGKILNCSIHSISSGMSSTCPSLMVSTFPEWWLLTVLYFCTWDFSTVCTTHWERVWSCGFNFGEKWEQGRLCSCFSEHEHSVFLTTTLNRASMFLALSWGRIPPCLVKTEGYSSQPPWPCIPANVHLVMISLLPLPFPPLGMEYSNGNHIPRTDYLLSLCETTYSLSLKNFFLPFLGIKCRRIGPVECFQPVNLKEKILFIMSFLLDYKVHGGANHHVCLLCHCRIGSYHKI